MKPFHKTNTDITVLATNALAGNLMLGGAVITEAIRLTVTGFPENQKAFESFDKMLDVFLGDKSVTDQDLMLVSETIATGILPEVHNIDVVDHVDFGKRAMSRLQSSFMKLSTNSVKNLPKTTAALDELSKHMGQLKADKPSDALTGPASNAAKTGAARGTTNDADFANRSSPGYNKTKGAEVAGEGDRQVA